MTDRELLEAAARACGGVLSQGTGKRRTGDSWDSWEWYGPLGILMLDGRVTYPLTDDGDALRLAVKLNLHAMRSSSLCVECYGEKAPFDSDGPHSSTWRSLARCWFGDGVPPEVEAERDQLAATRRAIVRAAATVGAGKE